MLFPTVYSLSNFYHKSGYPDLSKLDFQKVHRKYFSQKKKYLFNCMSVSYNYFLKLFREVLLIIDEIIKSFNKKIKQNL